MNNGKSNEDFAQLTVSRQFRKFHRLCFFDLETTDRYWNSCGPIQIAAVICDETGEIIDKFEEKIKTTHRIAPDASEVHGIYASDLVNCRSELAVLTDFVAWLKQQEVDCILGYNNRAFDNRVLVRRCEIFNLPDSWFFNPEKFPNYDGYYDCVKIAKDRNLFGLKDALGRKWKLTLVADHLGFSTDNAHDAYFDVIMLKNIFFKLDPIVNPEHWEQAAKTSLWG